MARYAYHDFYDVQFEKLVAAICSFLLGPGVQSFSSGPDGGRDARFSGTAAELPNNSHPYSGEFVVQAKHTEHPFAKFSDPGFSGNAESATLAEEIPRLKKLVISDDCDHYLLFSNRRLAGNAEASIRKRILSETGVQTVTIFGIETIESLIKQFPRIPAVADISEVNLPMRVAPDDLAEVILAMAENKKVFAEASQPTPIQRTAFKAKNSVNGLSEKFEKLIRSNYVPYFEQVRRFLGQAPNSQVLERYLEAVAEFNDKLVCHRDEWPDFGDALVYLQDILLQRDGDLRRNKRMTKLAVYYMYWNCDIGDDGLNEEDDA